MLQLIAVQAEMGPSDYLTAAAFRARILALTEEAVAGLDPRPRLLAFPEAIGFPLLLLLDGPAAGAGRGTATSAALDLAARSWRVLLAGLLRRPRPPLQALYALRAPTVYKAYRDAFAAAARLAGATVVAGTLFTPHVEEEAARGLHVAGRRVFNTAFVFAPSGRLLGRSRKVYLTPGAESRSGLSPGRLEDLAPVATPLGSLGVAVCLDGFYQGVIERFDGQGAEIVVQPSANHASWERPWPPDPSLREGEAWLERGLRAQIQDRLHIRYGVNPMLVGDVFDLHPRGRSNIVANLALWPEGLSLPATPVSGRHPGVIALAATSDRGEIVRAEVPSEAGPGSRWGS